VKKCGSISYSRLADRYEQLRGGNARAVSLTEAMRPWITDGVVCDVGAGTGVVTEHLRRPGLELFACDLSFEMLSKASTRFPNRIHVADAIALALRDESVDTLTYVWVLHLVGDPAATLAEARRVLRPGGRVISISGVSLPTDDDMSPIFERLNDQLRPERRDQATAIASTGVDLGLAAVHEGFASTTAAMSPDELAESIAQRHFSHLWDLPEAEWTTCVEPAIDELRSLPNPNTPRHRTFQHPLVVLSKP
jgi:SAM-dependent methyltransferase